MRITKGLYDFDDVLQAARFGLIRAAATWKDGKGASFPSHAFDAMDGWIMRFMNQQRRQTGWAYAPTAKQKAEGMTGMVREVVVTAWPTNEEGEHLDVADSREPDLDGDIHRARQRSIVMAAMSNDRERFILASMLDGKTLNWIGDQLGVTGERVRQIQALIMAKARQAAVASGAASQ